MIRFALTTFCTTVFFIVVLLNLKLMLIVLAIGVVAGILMAIFKKNEHPTTMGASVEKPSSPKQTNLIAQTVATGAAVLDAAALLRNLHESKDELDSVKKNDYPNHDYLDADELDMAAELDEIDEVDEVEDLNQYQELYEDNDFDRDEYYENEDYDNDNDYSYDSHDDWSDNSHDDWSDDNNYDDDRDY